MKKLLLEALIKFFSGFIIIALLLFVSSFDIKWFNAWLFICLLFIPMFIVGIIMFFKAPDLLRSRLNAKEKEKTQQGVLKYSGLMFIASFVLAGLNHRFNWLNCPNYVIIISSILFLLSYLMFGEVLRENAYLSRTIEVKENQKVVDTGLYGIIRHPMYSATVVLFLSMPLILNSPVSFIISLTYIPLIVIKIKNEEMVLEKDLQGYKEYKQKVKYRLIPFIW